MNKRNAPLLALLACLVFSSLLCAQADTDKPKQDTPVIRRCTLEYPSPAIPYYHFRAELNTPAPSMLDVEAAVNGEKLRLVAIKDLAKPIDPKRPIIHYRPPFANTYTVDSTVYARPYVIGWLPWRPGQTYKIDLKVRIRKGLKPAETDLVAEGSVTVTAPREAQVFDAAWKDYKALVLSETAGIDRKGEPVDIVMAFYADQAENLANSIRVVAVDPNTHAITEVPSQTYDIKTDVVMGDPRVKSASAYGRSTYAVQIWVPTVTARVAFLADMPANSSRVYLVYHNNPDAKTPKYDTALSISGPAPGLTFDKETGKVRGVPIQIENEQIKVALHPHSGVLYELTLKSKPDRMLYHKMETNGSIHWAPEAYPPPRPWTHTSDWTQPKFQSWSGPVGVTTLARGPLPHIPEVDAAVSYKFYAGKPYIISTTSMRVNEPIAVQAMRNGEVVFKRGLLTHLSWYDAIDRQIKTVDLERIADLDEHLMELDVPWITFFNPTTGIAFGGIQIEHANAGLEHLPRVWNPYVYVIVGPVIYWSRAMNFTFASSASQLMIESPKGSFFWEKWGFVLYEPAEGDNPHAPLLEWQTKLTHPLRVRLVEEVEPRVPTVGTEIYIDPSKTGWEERETAK